MPEKMPMGEMDLIVIGLSGTKFTLIQKEKVEDIIKTYTEEYPF